MIKFIRTSMYAVISRLLGVLLVVAGCMKIADFPSVLSIGGEYFFPRSLLATSVGLELIFGVWLIIGLHPRLTRRLALLFFSVLACIAAYKGLSGASSCGCFGRASVNPWISFCIDIVAMAALVVCRPDSHQLCSRDTFIKGIAFFAVSAGLCVWVVLLGLGIGGHSLSDDGLNIADGVVVLEPSSWIGRRLPLLKYIDIGNELADGSWLLVLYHHDCSACREALPRYRRLAVGVGGRGETMRVAMVELPPYGKLGADFDKIDSKIKFGRLDDVYDWFVQTPMEINISDGYVLNSANKNER